jgi:hypothetical protein
VTFVFISLQCLQKPKAAITLNGKGIL